MHKCTENTYAFVCLYILDNLYRRYIQLFVKKFYNIPYIVICEDVRINSIDKFYR